MVILTALNLVISDAAEPLCSFIDGCSAAICTAHQSGFLLVNLLHEFIGF
jgi:hypothetical protein